MSSNLTKLRELVQQLDGKLDRKTGMAMVPDIWVNIYDMYAEARRLVDAAETEDGDE